MPEEIFAYRRLGDFLARVPALLEATTVASLDGRVVGFVMVEDDELHQLYVDPTARGAGVAGALLERGETIIAGGYDRAWLAVVAGNARARRFYERQGWRRTAEIRQPSYAGPGREVGIPALRYEKVVRPAQVSDTS